MARINLNLRDHQAKLLLHGDGLQDLGHMIRTLVTESGEGLHKNLADSIASLIVSCGEHAVDMSNDIDVALLPPNSVEME